MRFTGKLLLIIGIIYFIVAFNFDVTVETIDGGRINNIGLIAQKSNHLTLAALIIISGLLTYVFSNLFGVSSDRLDCPYCAEKIKREAKVCKFCHKELPVAWSFKGDGIKQAKPKVKIDTATNEANTDELSKLGYRKCKKCSALNKLSNVKCVSCEISF